MKLIKKFVKSNNLLIIFVLIFVNLLFMKFFWEEIFFDKFKVGAVWAEVVALEWKTEQVYQNMINGHNPFAPTNRFFYPFGTDLVSAEAGNGYYFVFLRPFLSTHQSMFVITAFGLLFSSIGMYLLLRNLKMEKWISVLFALAFSYTTFLQPRGAHTTYFSLYVFPWFFLCLLTILKSNDLGKKILSTIGMGLMANLALFVNLYFFIILVWSVIFLFVYTLIWEIKLLIKLILKNYIFLFFSGIVFLLFISPWLIALFDVYTFETLPRAPGWGGAITLSADVFHYFLPSRFAFFMHYFENFISSRFVFAQGVFENYVYPGLFILGSYAILFYLIIKRKTPKKLKRHLWPLLFVSMAFALLTLGPFLHVLGKWWIEVDEGIRIVFPMPYLIFHYVPFMTNVRAPGRLVVGFIFFATIVTAYLFNYFVNKKSERVKIILIIAGFVIFFVDHIFWVRTPPPPVFLPKNIYRTIANDKSFATLYEIPSTVRDGFVYFGDKDGLYFIYGMFYHNKPVLGGHTGRLPKYKFEYYQNNPFFGYIGKLMDPELASNVGLLEHERVLLLKINKKASIDAIDFLDLKYILVNDKMPYSASTSAMLSSLGFKKTMTEKNYRLLTRTPSKREFLHINLSKPGADTYLGDGWVREDHDNLVQKKSSVLFKINKPRNMKLTINGRTFFKPQTGKVYVNRKYLGEIVLSTVGASHSFNIPKAKLKQGINEVHIFLTKEYPYNEIEKGSNDLNRYSGQFKSFSIKDN